MKAKYEFQHGDTIQYIGGCDEKGIRNGVFLHYNEQSQKTLTFEREGIWFTIPSIECKPMYEDGCPHSRITINGSQVMVGTPPVLPPNMKWIIASHIHEGNPRQLKGFEFEDFKHVRYCGPSGKYHKFVGDHTTFLMCRFDFKQ